MNSSKRAIEPLSQRLPKILAYPASKTMLWMFAALCALRLLANLPNILGLLFEIVFWLMGFKLAVEALVNTAHGRLEPLGSEDLMATDGDGWRQLVLVVLVASVIGAVAAWIGGGAALFGLALAVLFLPAAIILLAIDGSMANALNPLAWVSLIGRLGAAYLGAVAVLAVLVAVATAMQGLLASVLPAGMEMLPGGFISLYLLVASYHLLGYLIHQHHEALGLDIAPAVPRSALANPLEDEAVAEAQALAEDGQPAAAANRLEEMFRGRGASDELHDLYRQYLAKAGDRPRLAAHGREYICRLLATGKDKRALAVAAEMLADDPGYRHAHAADIARLVAQAERTGQSRLAVALAEEFESRFPGSPDAAQVLLTATTLMADKLGREHEALTRLKASLPRLAGDPLAPRLRESLAGVERLCEISRSAR
jgi:hypothetical protein